MTPRPRAAPGATSDASRHESAETDVLIVGAGPSGMLLAAELARLGIATVLLERRAAAAPGSRAIGVHPPTLSALEPSGATEEILAAAARIPRGVARAAGRTVGEVRFDRSPGRFPFVASVPQSVTEQALASRGPAPQRGIRVESLRHHEGAVEVLATDPGGDSLHWRARCVIVASGGEGRSLVRGLLPMRSHAYPDRYLMTDLPTAPGEPEDAAVITLGPGGVAESFPLPGGGRRLVARIGRAQAPEDAPAAELLAAAIAGRVRDRALAARITDASGFGIRRILLGRLISEHGGLVIAIGDTAHEVSPIGGQGMNLGLLDAATLAPRLASFLAHPGPEERAALARWEHRRVASARIAARIAGLNTTLGRPWPRRATSLIAAAFGAALRTPLERLPERAYAMGFDRDA